MATFLLIDDDDAERIAEVLEDHAPDLYEKLMPALYRHAQAVCPEWISALIRHEVACTEGQSDRVADALQACQDAIIEDIEDMGLDGKRFNLTSADAERAAWRRAHG